MTKAKLTEKIEVQEDFKRGQFPEEITNSYTVDEMRVLFDPVKYREMLDKVPKEGVDRG